MMRGANQPTPQPMFMKAFRIYLNIEMIDGTGDSHKNQHHNDRPVVHGHEQDDNRNNDGLKKAFTRMK